MVKNPYGLDISDPLLPGLTKKKHFCGDMLCMQSDKICKTVVIAQQFHLAMVENIC